MHFWWNIGRKHSVAQAVTANREPTRHRNNRNKSDYQLQDCTLLSFLIIMRIANGSMFMANAIYELIDDVVTSEVVLPRN